MKRKKSLKKEILNRINILKYLTVLLFMILILRCSYLSIIRKNFYSEKLSKIVNTTYSYSSSPRGKIYDRNYNVIVDNREVPTLYYLKRKNISFNTEIKYANLIAEIVNIDYSKLTERMMKDYYLVKNESLVKSLITNKEKEMYDERKLTNSDIYYLKLSRIKEEDLKSLTESDRKSSYIYYLMNNGYSYEEKVIKKELTDLEIAKVYDCLKEIPDFYIKYSWERFYPYGNTFKSILGNISKISKEEKDKYLSLGYSLNDEVGSSYIEKEYENYLHGIKGKYKIVGGDIIEVTKGERGSDIVLTIDIKLQQEIEKILKEEIIRAQKDAATKYFNKAFVVIKEPKTGEILAMSGVEAYMYNDVEHVKDVTVMTITSPVTPGSIVKGASILTGYNEGAIKIGEVMKDECIKIYSKPKKCSWMTLGYIDDIKALSLSSNVYQFKTALKVANIDYKYNMKIDNVDSAFLKYRKMFNSLGLGVDTEIDLPVDSKGEEGKKNDPDLYLNYVIGQYDTYTTMQLSEYISTIANKGTRIRPHLLKEVHKSDNNDDLGTLILEKESEVINKVNVDEKYINRVIDGFHEVVTNGLGKSYMRGISDAAGKTGTSESFYDSDFDGVIDKETLTNSFVGFFPKDNPKMSIALVFPNIVDDTYNGSRTWANMRITRLIVNKFNEMYSSNNE